MPTVQLPSYCEARTSAVAKFAPGPTPDRSDCPYVAHVVLFAQSEGMFAGRMYRTGDRILLCLRHGGEVYDAIHGRAWADWLDAYRSMAGRLPASKALGCINVDIPPT